MRIRIGFACLLAFTILVVNAQVRAGLSGKKNAPRAADLQKAGPQKTDARRIYLPDRVIVKLKTGKGFSKSSRQFGVSALDQFVQRYSVESVLSMFPGHEAPASTNKVDLSRFYVLKYSAPMDAFKVSRELSQQPDVEYAEPWYIYAVDACTPNDNLRFQQWSLTQILADSAWCISKGDTSVVIGIIDTGVQWNHPDLAANIWINPGEYGPDGRGGRKENNGIDDDGNGKVDDWHGWDFGGADYNAPVQDNDPSPTGFNNAHGTLTAGVAAASTNNAMGIAGVGYKCKILPVKTSSDNDVRTDAGGAFLVFWLQGIVYAADLGAAVLNLSFGGGGPSQAEQEVINYVTQKGTLVVAAAGNDNTISPSYPAAYDNVLSVAATTTNDVISSYSNFGPTIDVCAPGDNVLSTYYYSAYATASGTSLSAPNAVGVAALVKSLHKDYTGLQVGEQVRISCDDISSSNPGYSFYLGRGRINAVKALTVVSPSVRVSSFTISDSAGGNNNGLFEPGEVLALTATFENYLSPTTNAAKVTFISMDPVNLQVLDSVFTLGALSTLSSVTNAATPLRFKVNSSAPPNTFVYLRLSFQDNGYNDFQFIQLLVNPLFATHNVNNVAFSISNFGSLGYDDYTIPPYGVIFGGGFQFPRGTASALNQATIMVGTDQNHVSDNAYGNTVDANAVDFRVASNGAFRISKERFADQVFRCAFTDSGVMPLSNRLGLYVTQRSYAYSNPPDNDYVTLRYDIRNNSASTVSGAYVGIFADWDVSDPATNLLGYDAVRRLGYEWDSFGSNYYGVCLVYPSTAASFRAVDNPTYIYGGFTEANKYAFLSQGFVTTQGGNVSDWSMILSAGPYSMNPGDSVTVGFAFLGGTTLAALQTSADAAMAKWPLIMSVNDKPGNQLPASYSLRQNYPNPFNPTTSIPYTLPAASIVSLKVFDLLGREIAILVNGEQPAGSYRVPVDASGWASGVYFCRLTASGLSYNSNSSFSDVRKLILAK